MYHFSIVNIRSKIHKRTAAQSAQEEMIMIGIWFGESYGSEIRVRTIDHPSFPSRLQISDPCPFCGGAFRNATDSELDEMCHPDAWSVESAIICSTCGAYADNGYD